MKESFSALARQYRSALLEDVIPFWQQRSLDTDHGGYLTCLDRKGRVYDTDKFIWLQARQVWTFSTLYTEIEPRGEWLEVAEHGVRFLRKHARNPEGHWYFSVDRVGRPLVQPYSIFSDCFAAMAFAAFARAKGEDQAAATALQTYRNILRRRHNPKGPYEKTVPNTRPLRNLALPMLLCNLTLEMESVLPPSEVDRNTLRFAREVVDTFLDPDMSLFFENRAPDRGRVDCFDGRLINPGHGMECSWFLLRIAERFGDRELSERACKALIRTLEFSWDEQWGGIFYFLDVDGHPTQQLEWSHKLWWVHLEALVALALALRFGGPSECFSWLERVHDYVWTRFPDPEYGEWYGYLNRRGEIQLSLKGGKWKGCFHLPRALLLCWKAFEMLEPN